MFNVHTKVLSWHELDLCQVWVVGVSDAVVDGTGCTDDPFPARIDAGVTPDDGSDEAAAAAATAARTDSPFSEFFKLIPGIMIRSHY